MLDNEIMDIDGGEMDLELDTDNDGIVDTVVNYFDVNGDGKPDISTITSDTNNDGLVDVASVYSDTNGDGLVDVVENMRDLNRDGLFDSINTYKDQNGDGQFDYLSKAYDSDGDGSLDVNDVYVDTGGDGNADIHNTYGFDHESGELYPCSAAGLEVGGTFFTELDTFDPSLVHDLEDISGDPASAMERWKFQGDTQRCALYSQKFVIEELTGKEIDMNDFAEKAKENGWFTESGGTTFLNMNKMLDLYGIENEMSFHNSINDIEECLDSGGKVIVSIDSDEIWHGFADDIFAPESSADHAVEVIGIDRSDPNNPMVILNDSGTPYGRGEMVPMDVFEGAWEDGDCQMISCKGK